jgi:EF-hand domain pair
MTALNNDYSDTSTSPQDTPTLDITSTETVEEIVELDTTPSGDGSYTADELQEEVDGLSEEDAEALVEIFDQNGNGDGKLDETETETMQTVLEEAVDSGKLKDGHLTDKDLIILMAQIFFDSSVSQVMNAVCEQFNTDEELAVQQQQRRTEQLQTDRNRVEQSHEQAIQKQDNSESEDLSEKKPRLPAILIQQLIQRFDTNGNGRLDQPEIVKMTDFIKQALSKNAPENIDSPIPDDTDFPPEHCTLMA